MFNQYLLVIRVLHDANGRVGLARIQSAMSHVSKYRVKNMLIELRNLGFVNRVGNQFELTPGGNALYEADGLAWTYQMERDVK
jgi:Mn-dependent DtxR family transcriptional regulator